MYASQLPHLSITFRPSSIPIHLFPNMSIRITLTESLISHYYLWCKFAKNHERGVLSKVTVPILGSDLRFFFYRTGRGEWGIKSISNPRKEKSGVIANTHRTIDPETTPWADANEMNFHCPYRLVKSWIDNAERQSASRYFIFASGSC